MGKPFHHRFRKSHRQPSPTEVDAKAIERWTGLHLRLSLEEELELRSDSDWGIDYCTDEANQPTKRFVRTLRLSCYVTPAQPDLEDPELYIVDQFRLANILNGNVAGPEPELVKTPMTDDLVTYEFTLPGRLTRADRMCLNDIDDYLERREEDIFLAAVAHRHHLPASPSTP